MLSLSFTGVLMVGFACVAYTECAKDYASALKKSILFFDTQRSGKLPADNPISWRGDSALNDCVTGGWYDAGDHIKFTLPMSASTTILLWSLNRFKDAYSSSGTLDQMYDMVKWPLDFFLKAWDPTAKTLVAQVGDGNADHGWWGRPEDMTMARPCTYISATEKGSDISGGVAAALAAGAIAFKDKGDTAYSSQLLSAAESLYAFAKANRGISNASHGLYDSYSEKDEMCEASLFLHKATQKSNYLDDAKTYLENYPPWSFDWENKQAACRQLLYEETQSSVYKDAVVEYLTTWLPGGTLTYTPCGLAWRIKWGSLREAANNAFIALVAAESGIESDKYRKWAVEQINYILGDNPHDGGCFSYQVGYGTKYPLHPHHRGSSCPDRPAPCDWNNFNSTAPNPQVLVGALVGGPDENDIYEDKRDDYVTNEVATEYNAGFQGALAAIIHLQSKNLLPVTNNKCPCTAA
ncbi:endoglucanase A-like isoform X2 [Biomphalaria glabrata]|uniref:Endoglucanase n=1 Tax=Biomphalaria glabrata TaxID=6526 RepID=A0A9U8DY86_BIOGL|nr:endoglucanase A-like [Biomphalaria glabrata]KAI8728229.1 endoglucanase A-like isoform X2 [Biomphalaria glabrata]